MSSQLGKVISLIISERFGPVVEQVATYLFRYGTNPLLYIKKGIDLPLSKIKEALCILIKFRLVSFTPNKNGAIANYTLHPDRILLMIRYPKYISLIKKRMGDGAEILLEELLQRGYCSASELLLVASVRFQKEKKRAVPLQTLRDNLFALITAQYMCRLPYAKEEAPVPCLELKEEERFILPSIDLKCLQQSQTDPSVVLPDSEVYWTVNFDRFHQDMRDKIIISAFSKKFDENSAELVRIMLEQMYIRTTPWAECSNPIALLDVKETVKKKGTHPQLTAFFDQYATSLEQDSNNLIRKVGDAGGGSFQICMKDIFTALTWEAVEQIVLEKFDTKAARIFRLVKTKRYIEPDQIQQLAMIPAKEAKRLTYQLLEENFFEVQELRKATASNEPTKTFTLFYIDIEQIVRMLLELCYKTLFNLMTRRNYDKLVNKRIIDKKERVDTISLGMRVQGADDEQLADIEEMITPPEREILEKIDKTMKRLNMSELEVDDTMFLLQMYIAYENK